MGNKWSGMSIKKARSSWSMNHMSHGIFRRYNSEDASTQYQEQPPQSDSHYVGVEETANSRTNSSNRGSHKLWERHNPEQQSLVCRSDRYKNVLREKLTDLVQSVDVKPILRVLEQLHVINANKRESIEHDATQADMVMRIVEHVQRGPLWHLHGFLRALAVTEQEYLIAVLGLDSAVYEDPATSNVQMLNSSSARQKRHFYRYGDNDETWEFPMDLLPGILQHYDRNLRMLMKTTLFGIDDNTPLELTPIYINQDPSYKINQREFQSISSEALFAKMSGDHSPNSILIEGDTGSGKSTFLHQYAHTCCRDLLMCHKRGPDFPCQGHQWKLITYIAAGSITGSQEVAIRESLLCDENLKDGIMGMIKEEGNGVLIINDGIDELKKQPAKESLRQFAIFHQKDGKPKLLASSRSRLSPIEGKFFDRCLWMKGFSLDQGLTYMKTYLRTRHHLAGHLVLDYISSRRKDFEWLLMNPLRVHILSELTAKKAITLKDLRSLTTVKLLKIFEEFLVKRDERRNGTDRADDHSKSFYRLCLECLMKDERRIPEAAIPSSSPYLVFLSKHTDLDEYAKENNFFMFSHEMLLEFMAIQGLIEYLKSEPVQKNALLLFMCSDPNMRTALQLVCGYISEYEPSLVPDLIFITRACLILQTEVVVCKRIRLTEKLLELPTRIRDTMSSVSLSEGFTSEQMRTMKKTYKKIQRAFKKNAKSLQKAGWFSNALPEDLYFVQSGIHEFVTGCMSQFGQELQDTIYRQTIHRLLPCTRYNMVHRDGTERNYDQFVFPTSTGRWGLVNTHKVTSYSTTNIVVAWSPSDIVETLTRLYSYLAPWTSEYRVYLDLENPVSLWGVQAPELLTHEQWVAAFSQILTRRVDLININTETVYCTSPLNGLVTALQHVVPPIHTLSRGIYLWHGQVEEELLEQFCEWTLKVKVPVRLCHTTVLLNGYKNENDVIRLHQRVQELMHIEQPPIYRREDGETFQVPQHAWKMFGIAVRKRRDRYHMYS